MAVTEMTTWDSLRLLRMNGKRPEMPVIVTSLPQLPQRLWGVGCMVILHKAGDPMPVTLLDGLDVIFMFATCVLVERVWQLARSKGVRPARWQAWCNCEQGLTIAPIRCDSYVGTLVWLGGINAA